MCVDVKLPLGIVVEDEPEFLVEMELPARFEDSLATCGKMKRQDPLQSD